jgi:glycine C-acetyltransferase
VHTDEDIQLTLQAFEETKAKLGQGAYRTEAIPDMANA